MPTLVQQPSRRRSSTTSSSSHSKGSTSSSSSALPKKGHDKDESELLLSSSTSNNSNRYYFLRKIIPPRYLPHLNSKQLENIIHSISKQYCYQSKDERNVYARLDTPTQEQLQQYYGIKSIGGCSDSKTLLPSSESPKQSRKKKKQLSKEQHQLQLQKLQETKSQLLTIASNSLELLEIAFSEINKIASTKYWKYIAYNVLHSEKSVVVTVTLNGGGVDNKGPGIVISEVDTFDLLHHDNGDDDDTIRRGDNGNEPNRKKWLCIQSIRDDGGLSQILDAKIFDRDSKCNDINNDDDNDDDNDDRGCVCFLAEIGGKEVHSNDEVVQVWTNLKSKAASTTTTTGTMEFQYTIGLVISSAERAARYIKRTSKGNNDEWKPPLLRRLLNRDELEWPSLSYDGNRRRRDGDDGNIQVVSLISDDHGDESKDDEDENEDAEFDDTFECNNNDTKSESENEDKDEDAEFDDSFECNSMKDKKRMQHPTTTINNYNKEQNRKKEQQNDKKHPKLTGKKKNTKKKCRRKKNELSINLVERTTASDSTEDSIAVKNTRIRRRNIVDDTGGSGSDSGSSNDSVVVSTNNINIKKSIVETTTDSNGSSNDDSSITTNHKKNWKYFMNRYRDIATIEYETKLRRMAVFSFMWDKHKLYLGETCSAACPCPNYLSKMLSKILAHKKTWCTKTSKLEIRNFYKSGGIGFVTNFFPVIYRKVCDVFPSDRTHDLLMKDTLKMWDLHKKSRVFGPYCRQGCLCSTIGWDTLFLPSLNKGEEDCGIIEKSARISNTEKALLLVEEKVLAISKQQSSSVPICKMSMSIPRKRKRKELEHEKEKSPVKRHAITKSASESRTIGEGLLVKKHANTKSASESRIIGEGLLVKKHAITKSASESRLIGEGLLVKKHAITKSASESRIINSSRSSSRPESRVNDSNSRTNNNKILKTGMVEMIKTNLSRLDDNRNNLKTNLSRLDENHNSNSNATFIHVVNNKKKSLAECKSMHQSVTPTSLSKNSQCSFISASAPMKKRKELEEARSRHESRVDSNRYNILNTGVEIKTRLSRLDDNRNINTDIHVINNKKKNIVEGKSMHQSVTPTPLSKNSQCSPNHSPTTFRRAGHFNNNSEFSKTFDTNFPLGLYCETISLPNNDTMCIVRSICPNGQSSSEKRIVPGIIIFRTSISGGFSVTNVSSHSTLKNTLKCFRSKKKAWMADIYFCNPSSSIIISNPLLFSPIPATTCDIWDSEGSFWFVPGKFGWAGGAQMNLSSKVSKLVKDVDNRVDYVLPSSSAMRQKDIKLTNTVPTKHILNGNGNREVITTETATTIIKQPVSVLNDDKSDWFRKSTTQFTSGKKKAISIPHFNVTSSAQIMATKTTKLLPLSSVRKLNRYSDRDNPCPELGRTAEVLGIMTKKLVEIKIGLKGHNTIKYNSDIHQTTNSNTLTTAPSVKVNKPRVLFQNLEKKDCYDSDMEPLTQNSVKVDMLAEHQSRPRGCVTRINGAPFRYESLPNASLVSVDKGREGQGVKIGSFVIDFAEEFANRRNAVSMSRQKRKNRDNITSHTWEERYNSSFSCIMCKQSRGKILVCKKCRCCHKCGSHEVCQHSSPDNSLPQQLCFNLYSLFENRYQQALRAAFGISALCTVELDSTSDRDVLNSVTSSINEGEGFSQLNSDKLRDIELRKAEQSPPCAIAAASFLREEPRLINVSLTRGKLSREDLIVKSCVRGGKDVIVGRTIVFAASEHFNRNFLLSLLRIGADCRHKDVDRKRPIDIAKQKLKKLQDKVSEKSAVDDTELQDCKDKIQLLKLYGEGPRIADLCYGLYKWFTMQISVKKIENLVFSHAGKEKVNEDGLSYTLYCAIVWEGVTTQTDVLPLVQSTQWNNNDKNLHRFRLNTAIPSTYMNKMMTINLFVGIPHVKSIKVASWNIPGEKINDISKSAQAVTGKYDLSSQELNSGTAYVDIRKLEYDHKYEGEKRKQLQKSLKEMIDIIDHLRLNRNMVGSLDCVVAFPTSQNINVMHCAVNVLSKTLLSRLLLSGGDPNDDNGCVLGSPSCFLSLLPMTVERKSIEEILKGSLDPEQVLEIESEKLSSSSKNSDSSSISKHVLGKMSLSKSLPSYSSPQTILRDGNENLNDEINSNLTNRKRSLLLKCSSDSSLVQRRKIDNLERQKLDSVLHKPYQGSDKFLKSDIVSQSLDVENATIDNKVTVDDCTHPHSLVDSKYLRKQISDSALLKPCRGSDRYSRSNKMGPNLDEESIKDNPTDVDGYHHRELLLKKKDLSKQRSDSALLKPCQGSDRFSKSNEIDQTFNFENATNNDKSAVDGNYPPPPPPHVKNNTGSDRWERPLQSINRSQESYTQNEDGRNSNPSIKIEMHNGRQNYYAKTQKEDTSSQLEDNMSTNISLDIRRYPKYKPLSLDSIPSVSMFDFERLTDVNSDWAHNSRDVCRNFLNLGGCRSGNQCIHVHIHNQPLKPQFICQLGDLHEAYKMNFSDVHPQESCYLKNIATGNGGRKWYAMIFRCPETETIYYAEHGHNAIRGEKGAVFYPKESDAVTAVDSIVIEDFRQRGRNLPDRITSTAKKTKKECGVSNSKALLEKKNIFNSEKIKDHNLPKMHKPDWMLKNLKRCVCYPLCNLSNCVFAHVFFGTDICKIKEPGLDTLIKVYQKNYKVDLKPSNREWRSFDVKGRTWYTSGLKCPVDGTFYYASGGKNCCIQSKQNLSWYPSKEDADNAVAGKVLSHHKKKGFDVSDFETDPSEVTNTIKEDCIPKSTEDDSSGHKVYASRVKSYNSNDQHIEQKKINKPSSVKMLPDDERTWMVEGKKNLRLCTQFPHCNSRCKYTHLFEPPAIPPVGKGAPSEDAIYIAYKENFGIELSPQNFIIRKREIVDKIGLLYWYTAFLRCPSTNIIYRSVGGMNCHESLQGVWWYANKQDAIKGCCISAIEDFRQKKLPHSSWSNKQPW